MIARCKIRKEGDQVLKQIMNQEIEQVTQFATWEL